MQSLGKEVSKSLLIQGILATVFGVVSVFWPKITLVSLIYIFSSFILLSGVVELIYTINRFGSSTMTTFSRFWGVLVSVMQIGVGTYLLQHPKTGIKTLLILIAIVFIVRGLLSLLTVFMEKVESGLYRFVMITSGVLSIAAGLFVLVQPVASGVAFVWVLGIYALISGPLLIALSAEAKKFVEELDRQKKVK